MDEARILLEVGKYNATVNRVYYACFYAVLAILTTKNLCSAKHKGVRLLFNKEFVKTGEIESESYQFYAGLFDNRQESDYKDFKEFTEEETQQMYDNATGFVRMLESKLEHLLSKNN